MGSCGTGEVKRRRASIERQRFRQQHGAVKQPRVVSSALTMALTIFRPLSGSQRPRAAFLQPRSSVEANSQARASVSQSFGIEAWVTLE